MKRLLTVFFTVLVALLAIGTRTRSDALQYTACLYPPSGGVLNVHGTYPCPDITPGPGATATAIPIRNIVPGGFTLPGGYTAGYNAYDFRDSVGVNTHFFPYPNFTNEPNLRDTMLALRISHIRDGLSAVNSNASMIASLNDLAAHGITANLIVDHGISASSIASIVGQLNAGVVESLEGPNELNSCCHDANWIADDQAEMAAIKTAVSTYPALAGIKIYGPSLSLANYNQLGDLSAYADYSVMHNYMGGRHPETPGYGNFLYCEPYTYGGIVYNECNSKQSAVSKPVVTTENGYCSVTYTEQRVADDTKAFYTLRLLMQHYAFGIHKTFIYDLISEDNNDYFAGSDCDHTYGLLRTDGSQPPVIPAMAGFMAILADATPRTSTCTVPAVFATPTPLLYPVEVFPLCKSSGEMDIVYWLPAMDYSPDALAYVTPPDETTAVTLASGFSPTSTVLWSMDRTGAWTATSAPNLSSLTASVIPRILVLNGPAPTALPVLPTPPPTPTPTATPTAPPPTPTPAPTATPTALVINQTCGNTIPSTGALAFPIACATAPAYGDYLITAFDFGWYQAPRDVILPPQTGGWAQLDPITPYDVVPTVSGVNNYASAFNTQGQALWAKYVTSQLGEPATQNWLVGSGNNSSGISYDIRGVDSSAPIAVDTYTTGKFGPGPIVATCASVTVPRVGSYVLNLIANFAGSSHTGSVQVALNPPTSVTSGWTLDIAEEPPSFTTYGFHYGPTTSVNQVVGAMSVSISAAGSTFDPWICRTLVVQHP